MIMLRETITAAAVVLAAVLGAVLALPAMAEEEYVGGRVLLHLRENPGRKEAAFRIVRAFGSVLVK